MTQSSPQPSGEQTARIIPLKIHPTPDTPDWLRSFPGCGHYTDEEAGKIILALNALAPILLKRADNILQSVDSQLVSYLQQEKESLKLAA